MNVFNIWFLRFTFALLIVLVCGCASSVPKYYTSQPPIEDKNKLACFDESKIPSYYTAPLGNDQKEGKRATPQSCFYTDGSANNSCLAVQRANHIFSGRQGVFNGLFEKHCLESSGATDCPKQNPENKKSDEDPVHMNFSVAVSAFPVQQETVSSSDASSKSAPDGKSKPTDTASGQSSPGVQKAAASSNDSDLTKKITLVLSTYIRSLQPADRLEKIYALFTPINPEVEFVSMTQAKTEADLVDFGQQTNTNDVSLSALPIARMMNQLVTVTPTASSSYQKKINRQYITQSTEIFPLRNELLISEDGGPSQADISGNATVSVTIRIPIGLCQYIHVWSKDALASSGVQFTSKSTCYVESIPVLMAWVAIARKVTSGQETIPEDDDVVELVPFKSMQILDIWKNPRDIYGLEWDGQAIEAGVGNAKERLLFASLDDAMGFQDWLLGSSDETRKKLENGDLHLPEHDAKAQSAANPKLMWKKENEQNKVLSLCERIKSPPPSGLKVYRGLAICVYKKNTNTDSSSSIPVPIDYCHAKNDSVAEN